MLVVLSVSNKPFMMSVVALFFMTTALAIFVIVSCAMPGAEECY